MLGAPSALATDGEATAEKAPPPPIPPPTVVRGTPIYTFLAGDLVGRFCVAETDKKFVGVFLLLYNAGAAPVPLGPAAIRLVDWGDEKKRWDPVSYHDQLAHPPSWLALSTLLATPDEQLAAMLASRAPPVAPPPPVKKGKGKSSKARSPTAVAAEAVSIAWEAMKSAPPISPEMLLVDTTLAPGGATFAVVPFRSKLTRDNHYRVRLSLSGIEQEVEVQVRDPASATAPPTTSPP